MSGAFMRPFFFRPSDSGSLGGQEAVLSLVDLHGLWKAWAFFQATKSAIPRELQPVEPEPVISASGLFCSRRSNLLTRKSSSCGLNGLVT